MDKIGIIIYLFSRKPIRKAKYATLNTKIYPSKH